jgi:hypothetical protein
VQSGEEISGIDIRYRGDSGFAISGKVTGTTGTNALAGLQSTALVVLKRPDADDAISATIAIPGAGQSNFGFYGVPNGEYEVVAAQIGLNEENQSAAAPRRITVNGADQSGVELALTPLASIKGRVVAEKPATAEARTAAAKCANPRESQLDEIVVLNRKDDLNPKPELDLAVLGVNAPAVADQQGAFTLRGLTAGRYRIAARLPDTSWYLKALTLTPANPALPDPARNGLPVKSGEKLTGLTLTVAVGAASLKGTVKPAAGAKLPARLRVFLVPAEPVAKDDLLLFAEVEAESNGLFSFGQIAPGKYLLLARAVLESKSPDKPARPLAWDVAERAKLRKEAEAVNAPNTVVELKACQRRAEFVLTWK